MKLKRLVVLLLCLCMFISLLSACKKDSKPSTKEGGSNKELYADVLKPDVKDGNIYGGLTALPDANNPITYTMFVRDPGTAPSADNPVLKKITELTGVTIKFEFLVGDLDTKVGVMIAGEEYPDIIFAEPAKFVDAGAFIPLEDKWDDYPNLKAHYSPHKEKMTVADGHEYLLEIYGVVKNPAPIFKNNGAGFFIQKAVLEEAGYSIPKTLDEYFQIIENYIKKHPQIDGVKTIGFEVLSDGWRDFCLRNPAQHLMGAGNDGNVYVDPNTYVASLYQIDDAAKAYYKKLNDEYQKGVIEAETFTQSYDQYIARISTGAVLGFFDQGWNYAQGEDVLKADGKYNRTYVGVPIANPGVKAGYLDAPSNSITGNNGLGITIKCKNPERLLRFYDWLLQPEVQNYLQWGEEGSDYTVVNEIGKVLTKERRDIINDTAKKREQTGDTLLNYTPKRQGLYDDGSPCGPSDSEDEFLESQSDYDKQFLNNYGIKFPAELLSEPIERPAYYPVWAMSIEDGSDAKVAETRMVDICRLYYPQLVLSAPDKYDSLWDTFLEEIKSAHVQPYLDEVNRQISTYMNK